jgi:glycosyltransferase involved in cell wall biosynthesis
MNEIVINTTDAALLREPKISIIVPVYNAANYLPSMIDSILSQSFSDFELMLIDDGSSDGSADICDGYAAKDARVLVIHKANEGVSASRNLGADRARGKYLCFCDHDDELLPGALQTLFEAIEISSADMAHGATPMFFSKGEIKHALSNNKISYNSKQENIFDRYTEVFTLCQTIWGALYKTEFIRKNQICFATKYTNGGEDATFFLDIMKNNPLIICLPADVYTHYLRDGQSASSRYSYNFLRYHFEFSENEFSFLASQKREDLWLERWFFFFRQTLLLLSDSESDLKFAQRKKYLSEFLETASSKYATRRLAKISDIRISKRFVNICKIFLSIRNMTLLLILGKAAFCVRKNFGGGKLVFKAGK